MVEKHKELEKIPGFSQGVRRNAAARMIKMARPICPFSKKDMIRLPDGKFIPNPEPDPERQSCQEDRDENGNSRIGWWNDCEARGHNPYFTTRTWYSEEDIVDEETGEVKGRRRIPHSKTYPNVAQVAAHMRVNSGRGPRVKQVASGFKRLPEIGFAEVCQFRNCQKEVTVTCSVGDYCSNDHAMLCAADWYTILPYTIPRQGQPMIDEGYEGRASVKTREFEQQASFVAGTRAKP